MECNLRAVFFRITGSDYFDRFVRFSDMVTLEINLSLFVYFDTKFGGKRIYN